MLVEAVFGVYRKYVMTTNDQPGAGQSIYEEILDWSVSRPKWQQDALRRIITQTTVSNEDAAELTALCKKEAGLIDEASLTPEPLNEDHLPVIAQLQSRDSVTLLGIKDVQGVNALRPGEELNFGQEGLTIVYGDNGSGKSGYARILKNSCRCRAQEDIISDIRHERPEEPAAVIRLNDGTAEMDVNWSLEAPSLDSAVAPSVFDSHAAHIYVGNEQDVVYVPEGLDVLRRLAGVIDRVRQNLEEEARLSISHIDPAMMPNDPNARAFVDSIHAGTKLDDVEQAASWTVQHGKRNAEIGRQLANKDSESRASKARELSRQKNRIELLHRRVREIEQVLSPQAVMDILTQRRELVTKQAAAKLAAKNTFSDQPLEGVGSDVWRQLWQAARQYSVRHAYPGRSFPATEEGDRCVFCQQELSEGARERLSHFDRFVADETQKTADAAAIAVELLLAPVQGLTLEGTNDESDFAELREEYEDCENKLRECLTAAKLLCELVTSDHLANVTALPLPTASTMLGEALRKIEEEIKAYNSPLSPQLASLESERNQLQVRKQLSEIKPLIQKEVTRYKQLARLQTTIRALDTSQATRKNSELTRQIVSEELCRRFTEEAKALGLKSIAVDFEPRRGEKGILLHRVNIRGANDDATGIHSIASEGEQRCIALAAFFAETADTTSALIFDDPVSSLDHIHREAVAKRIAQEARNRQVIVFTHDLVFAKHLIDSAEQGGIALTTAYLTWHEDQPGHVVDGLPWHAMPTKRRVVALREEIQRITPLAATDPVRYREVAGVLYGRIRETWERAIEELLLNSVVERFRFGVETNRLRRLTDISESDWQTVESGMTRCSRWIVGHDEASAVQSTVPTPDEIENDIGELARWVTELKKRRN